MMRLEIKKTSVGFDRNTKSMAKYIAEKISKNLKKT